MTATSDDSGCADESQAPNARQAKADKVAIVRASAAPQPVRTRERVEPPQRLPERCRRDRPRGSSSVAPQPALGAVAPGLAVSMRPSGNAPVSREGDPPPVSPSGREGCRRLEPSLRRSWLLLRLLLLLRRRRRREDSLRRWLSRSPGSVWAAGAITVTRGASSAGSVIGSSGCAGPVLPSGLGRAGSPS